MCHLPGEGEEEDEMKSPIAKDFLVKLSLTDDKDKAKKEQYCEHIQSMLVVGEGEAIVELGVAVQDCTERGLISFLQFLLCFIILRFELGETNCNFHF